MKETAPCGVPQIVTIVLGQVILLHGFLCPEISLLIPRNRL
jgi:hypothetical protein